MANIKGKTKEEKQKELAEIVNTMNNRIEEVTQSPKELKEYMRFMSSFYKYSYSNSLLIQSQFMGATAVASFIDFKKKGFSVNKGEKGIFILVPFDIPKVFKDQDGKRKKVSEATPEEKKMLKQGQLKVIEQRGVGFTKGYVFDISQTNATAKDLPKIFPNRWLEGDVKHNDLLNTGINQFMRNLGIREKDNTNYNLGVAKGAYFPGSHEIILNPRNTQLQNIKTKIHELAHAALHRNSSLSNPEMEFQAELVAVSVASYFGIDTTEYSLPYLHNWTNGAKLENKKELLSGVHKTVKDMVSTIENAISQSKEMNLNKEEIRSTNGNEKSEMLQEKNDLTVTILIPIKESKQRAKSLERS